MSGSKRDAAVFPPAPDTTETLRLECLRLAVAPGRLPSEVLDAAAAYFAFLRPRAAERMAAEVPTVSP